jgi:hypothetical protein
MAHQMQTTTRDSAPFPEQCLLTTTWISGSSHILSIKSTSLYRGRPLLISTHHTTQNSWDQPHAHCLSTAHLVNSHSPISPQIPRPTIQVHLHLKHQFSSSGSSADVQFIIHVSIDTDSWEKQRMKYTQCPPNIIFSGENSGKFMSAQIITTTNPRWSALTKHTSYITYQHKTHVTLIENYPHHISHQLHSFPKYTKNFTQQSPYCNKFTTRADVRDEQTHVMNIISTQNNLNFIQNHLTCHFHHPFLSYLLNIHLSLSWSLACPDVRAS